MGIETPADLSGSECSFTSAIIAVEELAKVDASVAVMVDVHNTLVNTVLRLYGNDSVKEKWLPGLATEKVNLPMNPVSDQTDCLGRLVLSLRGCSW
jgi:alkylation response protein AidB-like acyl-CoA dehydrogenase